MESSLQRQNSRARGAAAGSAKPLLGIAALSFLCLALVARPAAAYTAAGDRIFSATISLPQIGPSDEAYLRSGTQSLHSATLPSSDDRLTNVTGVYDKMLTERLGLAIEGGYNALDRAGASTLTGWQNFEAILQYTAILAPENEFLLAVSIDREFGGSGAQRVGANPRGATTPLVSFGKGMGDVGLDYLRPIAVKGVFGYQLSDGGARPDQWIAGVAIEYSIPYLESKVQAVGLPGLFQNMTPQIELLLTTPSRSSPGTSTTLLVAPGIAYSGEGWEFGIEALVPATRTTGSGVGLIAQIHLSLDYLFPDSVGKPLFSRR